MLDDVKLFSLLFKEDLGYGTEGKKQCHPIHLGVFVPGSDAGIVSAPPSLHGHRHPGSGWRRPQLPGSESWGLGQLEGGEGASHGWA